MIARTVWTGSAREVRRVRPERRNPCSTAMLRCHRPPIARASCLTVPCAGSEAAANPQRQCQLRSHKMQGGSDWVLCAKRPPVTHPPELLQLHRQFAGDPVLPARFRFLHHPGNTAPEVPLYFDPIDADKTTEATLYSQPRSDVCPLSPSRSVDQCPQPSECSLGRHPSLLPD